MSIKNPPYVNFFDDRSGNPKIYFRRKGFPKISLRGPIGSKEFYEDYAKAYASSSPSGEINPEKNIGMKTIRWLCIQYFKSSAFKTLASSTKKVRRNILDGFCIEHGSKPFAQLKPEHLVSIQDDRADRPESVNALIKSLRQVFKHGIKRRLCFHNPAKEIEMLIAPGDGIHAWTENEIDQYRDCHAVGTKARMAIELLLYTGQRRGDIVRLGRQHLKHAELIFTQQKNRERSPVTLNIPIAPVLQGILDQTPTGELTFLVTHFNKPFTQNGFGNRFKKWCLEADLSHCSAHGLRKASAALFAEMGCTDREIMAITGHRSAKEVDRYTKSARQKKLARSAIAKVSAKQS